MTCKCHSTKEHEKRAKKLALQNANATKKYAKAKLQEKVTILEAQLTGMTPDSTKYDIVDAEQIGTSLFLKVVFPNCKACAFEGTKILIYFNTTFKNALRWRTLDPHFRQAPKVRRSVYDAPSPAARFPATVDGEDKAKSFLRFMAKNTFGLGEHYE